MLGIRMYIYISRERNRQTEMLPQRAVRLNGIGVRLVPQLKLAHQLGPRTCFQFWWSSYVVGLQNEEGKYLAL